MLAQKYDIDLIISKILSAKNSSKNIQNFLSRDEIEYLCLNSQDLLLNEPCLLELETPINLVSNTQGQFDDLIAIFEYCGHPPCANYLFLGDYADKGRQGLETICLLLAYKIKYPRNVFILRGNHECSSTGRIYGFYHEIKTRYCVKVWVAFVRVFNCMPIAAVVDEKIFCVHGGLSPELKSVEQIKNIKRPTDIPDSGLICDLLWGIYDKTIECWDTNSAGVSYNFGRVIVSKFLSSHNYSLLCTASEILDEGFEYDSEAKILKLFSTPGHYSNLSNNGAVLTIDSFLNFSFHIFKPKKKNQNPIKLTQNSK